MKMLMLAGGVVGFGVVVAVSGFRGNSWETILWRACLAGYAGALLMRWWGGLWMKGLHDSRRERIAAKKKEMAAKAANPTPSN
jgi:hypothetical protein